MSRLLLIFLFLTISCNFLTPEINFISSSDLNELEEAEYILIDVRTTDEFNSGHIEGSINIDFYDKKIFTEFFEKIEKSKPIFIYCRTGNRSKQSSELLKKIGFNSVFDLEGGYANWISNKN